MNIRSAYIPKSERGRKVAQAIRSAGYLYKNREVMGECLCTLYDVDKFPMRLLREIAYILDPERACYAEEEAYKVANEIRDAEDHDLYSADIAELEATRIENNWPIERW